MSGKDIRRKGHVFRGCCPIGLNAGRGGHEGHEDKSFKQELTEETEANPKRFLAGFKSFTLLPPFPPVQSFCVSVLPPSQGLRRANSLTFASRDCMGAKPDATQSRHLS